MTAQPLPKKKATTNQTCLVIALILTALLSLMCLIAGGVMMFRFINNPSLRSAVEGLGTEIKYMTELQQKLRETYGVEKVKINLQNGRTLQISLTNSEFNGLTQAQQSAHAYEIALFVKHNYAGIDGIVDITVSFLVQQEVGSLFAGRADNYTFQVSELVEK